MLGIKQRTADPVAAPPVPGLAGAMAAQEWQPVDQALFGGYLEHQVVAVTRALHGDPRPPDADHPAHHGAGAAVFGDAFCGVVNGRTVVVANSWTTVGGEHPGTTPEVKGVAVCVAELPFRLSIRCLQPRWIPTVFNLRTLPTGTPIFDERFVVMVAPGPAQPVLVPEVQARVLAHDDWVFVAERRRLVCVSRGPFTSPEEVGTRINEMVALVAAIPDPDKPVPAKDSADDLLARLLTIGSLPEALDLLQTLTPEDRQLLARSDTPLAAMAAVETPEEALERYKALDQSQKMEIMAMFERTREQA